MLLSLPSNHNTVVDMSFWKILGGVLLFDALFSKKRDRASAGLPWMRPPADTSYHDDTPDADDLRSRIDELQDSMGGWDECDVDELQERIDDIACRMDECDDVSSARYGRLQEKLDMIQSRLDEIEEEADMYDVQSELDDLCYEIDGFDDDYDCDDDDYLDDDDYSSDYDDSLFDDSVYSSSDPDDDL